MNVKWLLENDVFDSDLYPIFDELQKQDIEYKTINHKESNIKDLFDPEDCVVFYGSLGLSRIILKETSWVPGLYSDLPKFYCSYYYPRLSSELLNSDYIMLPFGELIRRKQFLLDVLGKEGKVFVRPDSSFKPFTGKVISLATWDSDVKFLGFYDVEPEKIVIVSSPKIIHAEWRLVVVNNVVVSGCQYIKNNEISIDSCPQAVMDYGNAVLNKFNFKPERAWILDVCSTNDDLKVIEVNAFSTSGLYRCPQESIVREVSRAAMQDWKDINEPS